MPRRKLIWIPIILAMVVALLLVWRQPNRTGFIPETSFAPVAQTYELISNYYYKPVDSEQLQRGAVEGMVRRLDAFSTYLSPEDAQVLNNRVMGKSYGLGLRLRFRAGETIVLGVLPGSPAHKAGIFTSTKILAVDDTPLAGLEPDEVKNLLAPDDDKNCRQVRLELLWPPTNQKSTVTLDYQEYPVQTVCGLYIQTQTDRWLYDIPDHDGIVYVRVVEFCPQTVSAFRRVVEEFTQRAVRGLVLDLRGNPGGLLTDGVALADMLLRDGPIVTIKSRGSKIELHHAHNDAVCAALPLVVLIDARTSSAAELLAGAIQASTRGVLIGSRTRGKGCVQSMVTLPGNLGQVNLTTAEFYIDIDHPVQRRPGMKNWGITPDIGLIPTGEQLKRFHRLQRSIRVFYPAPPSQYGEAFMALAAENECTPEEFMRQLNRDNVLRMLKADTVLLRAAELMVKDEKYRMIINRLRLERAVKQKQIKAAGQSPRTAPSN